MKIGIISDIHGNFVALKEALNLIRSKSVDLIYSAGDIVGYGPHPEECVKLITANAIESVSGNHDYAVNHPEEEDLFNAYARLAIQWTRKKLSVGSKEFLKSLPLFLTKEDFVIFHGTLDRENPFNYILLPDDAELSFLNLERQIGFFGHSHIPGCFIKELHGIITYMPGFSGCKISIEKDKKYLINVGSVGQPRDGNPMGSFSIFNTEERSVEIVRFPYDIDAVYSDVVKEGLPRFLVERLYSGV